MAAANGSSSPLAKAAEIMEEFTQAGINLPPWQIIKQVAEKRINCFNYLKRLHNGETHFFNTVKMNHEDLAIHYPVTKMKKRSAQWFYLGISLAPLLQSSDAVDYMKSLSLLMEEYEYEVSDYARQKMRQIFRKTKESSDEDPFAVEASYQETGLYSHLQTPNVPFDIDYFQVLYSLCDILVGVYQKIVDFTIASKSTNPAYADAFLRLDSRFKKIIALVTKEINTIARELIKAEITVIDPLFKSIERQWAADELDDGVLSS